MKSHQDYFSLFYQVLSQKQFGNFLLQMPIIYYIVTKYLDTEKVELLLSQDIQIESGKQQMQQLHRDHRHGHCSAIVVAMHIHGENIGTCFASGTHKDEYDETPCTNNLKEAEGNLVIYDPYMYHAGKKTNSKEYQIGRIFSIFVPRASQIKKELRKDL